MGNRTNKLIVDLNAIDRNIKEMKKLIADQEFYAVVKADSYGLGSQVISKHIHKDVDGYCVSSITEGLELRQVGIEKEILNLGFTQIEELDMACESRISICLYDLQVAKEMNSLLEKSAKKIKGHLKLDTGHGRLGFRQSEKSIEEIVELSKLGNIEIVGVFSHLATADEEDESYTLKQKEIFDYMINELEEKGVYLGKKHLANDAGFIKHGISYDLVRSGISLYGCYPSELLEQENAIELSKTFNWISKVSYVKYIEAGDYLSYGRTFKADRRMKIATVAVGYADGYKRAYSNKGHVLINGQRANVVGRVTMDQIMVDVSDIDQVNIGDIVTLIGKDGENEITVEMLAEWEDTINYEIMTSISKRVDRIYIGV